MLLLLFGLVVPASTLMSTTRWGRDASLRQAATATKAANATQATTNTTKTAAPAMAKKIPEWHKWFTLAVIIILFLLMAFDWRSTDTVAFMALVLLWNAGIISAADATAGFSNSAMLTVAVLFVVVHGVDKSQLAPYLGRRVFGLESGERWGLFRVQIFAFCLSAFLNNTPIVAMLTPIVRDWARTRGFHPSTFLIPLSYITASGGMITLIGTSTNLVITGLVTQAKLENIGFFDLALISLPAGILSLLVMVWLAPIVLPKNDGLFREIKASGSDIVTEVQILPNFQLVGKSAGYALTSLGFNVETLIKIRRPAVNLLVSQGGSSTEAATTAPADFTDIFPVDPSQVLLVGDILFLSGGKSKMMDVLRGVTKGLQILGFDSDSLEGDNLHFVEVILSDRNPFVGDVVQQSSFSSHYGVSILALRRKGRTDAEPVSSIPGGPAAKDHFALRGGPWMQTGSPFLVSPTEPSTVLMQGPPIPPAPFGYQQVPSLRARRVAVPPAQQVSESSSRTDPSAPDATEDDQDQHDPAYLEVGKSRLRIGDAILLLARDEFVQTYSSKPDFIMVQTVEKKLPAPRLFDYVPLLIFIAMIVTVAIPDTNIDMLQAAMAAAALLVFGGWVDAKTAVNHIEWDLLLLIGSMFGVAKAMQNSLLADAVAGLITSSGISALGILFVFYIITCILTEVLSNNGCAALCFPIVISIAKLLQVSYMPFVVSLMYGSTTSFLTPIGYQCNMMVWAPGGYKFSDFFKMGLPINIIYTIMVCLLAPAIWPFSDERYIIKN